MNLATFQQQPWERLFYDIDYSQWLAPLDNIESVTATSSDAALIISQVVNQDPFVKIWVSGGVSGKSYKITIRVTTADGLQKEDEITMKIKDS